MLDCQRNTMYSRLTMDVLYAPDSFKLAVDEETMITQADGLMQVFDIELKYKLKDNGVYDVLKVYNSDSTRIPEFTWDSYGTYLMLMDNPKHRKAMNKNREDFLNRQPLTDRERGAIATYHSLNSKVYVDDLNQLADTFIAGKDGETKQQYNMHEATLLQDMFFLMSIGEKNVAIVQKKAVMHKASKTRLSMTGQEWANQRYAGAAIMLGIDEEQVGRAIETLTSGIASN